MAKKKSKTSSAKKNGRHDHASNGNGANSTSPENRVQHDRNSKIKSNTSTTILGTVIAALLAVAIALFYTASSDTTRPSPSAIQNNHDENNDRQIQIQSAKDAFLKWFVDNGGTFHPIRFGDDAEVNVTIEEFPSYGGWGLALPLPLESSSFFQSNNFEEEEGGECKSENGEEQQCSSKNAKPAIKIIRHLDPLFTVPSSIIISIKSILDEYASPSNPLYYLPHFYSTVNEILTRTFPDGSPGLAKRGMGLVQQDVVMASYLMVEECLHRNHDLLFEKQKGEEEKVDSTTSRWGPYLDVFSQYAIPRLDTFVDEDYAALQDKKLEYAGRDSRRLLEQVYHNGGNSGSKSNGNDGDGATSLKAVVQDMIHKKMGATPAESPMLIPETCTSFETFHRHATIVSSRAMVLKGEKHLTPLAEMINYSPKVAETQSNEEKRDRIRAPFELYHTLSEDNSITVRSDRDVFTTVASSNDKKAIIQIFEDYGPVDSSLFLEAHGFVPHENPNNCATISGAFFQRRSTATGRYDENAELVLRALKSLYLIHPNAGRFEALEDVCAKETLEMVDDGNDIGRKPASDSIAIASLMLGDGGSNVWNRIESEYGESFAQLREKCTRAIRSRDVERMEIRCARFPGSISIVKQAVRTAARRTMGSLENEGNTEADRLLQIEQAESRGSEQLALALRFRMQEGRILGKIYRSPDEYDVFPEISAIKRQTKSPSIESSSESLEDKLKAFGSFVQSLELPLNKIEPKLVGNGMRIGAFAAEDLDIEDAYISLPDRSVIDVATALADVDATSNFASLLRKYSNSDGSESNDGYDALLLYILHERFILKDRSRWWAYLNLLPSIEELSEFHPLFFEENEIDRYLAGSDARHFILRYQRSAAERHAALSSDLDANLEIGSDILLDKKRVYWATAILDSRSIWWDGKRHLSPLLDLVNADGEGRVHETRLEIPEVGKQPVVVTKASRRVQKGEQVFENYAQPNYFLFTYQGFLLEDNMNDCALLDGLFIHRNDPGARSAHRLLQSLTPTFCIRDRASIQELAQFLRVKYDLPLENPPVSNIVDNDVRPYLVGVLEERIARLKESMDTKIDADRLASSRIHSMRQMVKNDLMHFQHAMDSHVSIQNDVKGG